MRAHDNSTGGKHPDCEVCSRKNCVASTTGGDLWCCYCGAHAGRHEQPKRGLRKPSCDTVRRRYYFRLIPDVVQPVKEKIKHVFFGCSPVLGYDNAGAYLELGADAVATEPPSLDIVNWRAFNGLLSKGYTEALQAYFTHAVWVDGAPRG